MNMNSKAIKILHRIMILLFLLAALFPIYWMLNTAFKTQGEVYSKIPTLIPKKPTLDNFSYLLFKTKFVNALKNSLVIAGAVTIFSIGIAYPAAYAIARIKFKGKEMFSKTILFCYLLPSSVLYIPLYIFVSLVGLSDSIWGLMLIYPTFTLPYVSWILIPHIASIPYDIEEAAIMDGCSRFMVMYRIIFPLALPGIAATAIYAFIQTWNEYMFTYILISSEYKKTLPVGIGQLNGYYRTEWNEMMAACFISALPVVIAFIFLQKYFIASLTAGAVKE